jgi:hypothetical protein
MQMVSRSVVKEISMRTRSEDSTTLPRPFPMPHPHRNMAVVMATPMRMASTLLISGKVVMRHKK